MTESNSSMAGGFPTGTDTSSLHGTNYMATAGYEGQTPARPALDRTGSTEMKYTRGLKSLRQELENRAILRYSGNTDAGQAALHQFWQHTVFTPLTVYSDASVNDKCEDFLA